jgi:predicted negative regulator of RcsB-dependent stress response
VARAGTKHSRREKRVDDYLSEREQIENLRAWIKDNVPYVAIGALLAAVYLWGWPQYQAWRLRQSSTASAKYAATLEALSHGDKTGAARLATELRSDYARTPYPDLAALAISRFDVESNDLADAATRLQALAQGANDPELRVVARLRLARVERAQGKPELALKTLAEPPAGAGPDFADVRGDALADKGDRDGALAAWREALAATTPGLVNRELIELKLAALGAAAAEPAATTPAAAGTKP